MHRASGSSERGKRRQEMDYLAGQNSLTRRSVAHWSRRRGRGAAQAKQSGPGVIRIKPPTSPLGDRNNAYTPPPASVTSPKRNASLALRTPVEGSAHQYLPAG